MSNRHAETGGSRRTALPAVHRFEINEGIPPALRLASTGTLTYGLSVGEVLGVSTLAGARLIGGASGIDRVVQRLNVMEVPDILAWVKPHELLLTTGYPLRNTPQSLDHLVRDLAERGLAALAIKLGRYLDDLPREMIEQADRLGFPLILLPNDVGFDDILNQVLTDILNRQAAVLARTEEVHRALVQIVLGGGGLQEVTDEVAALLEVAVIAVDGDRRMLAGSGSPEHITAIRTWLDAAARVPDSLRAGATDRPGRQIPGPGESRHVAVPVIAGGFDHGWIIAYGTSGSLQETDVGILERAATVAALVITKQQAVAAVESKYRADFLRDVLSGRAGDHDRVVAHCAGFGWNLDRPVAVVVAELDPAGRGADIADRHDRQDRHDRHDRERQDRMGRTGPSGVVPAAGASAGAAIAAMMTGGSGGSGHLGAAGAAGPAGVAGIGAAGTPGAAGGLSGLAAEAVAAEHPRTLRAEAPAPLPAQSAAQNRARNDERLAQVRLAGAWAAAVRRRDPRAAVASFAHEVVTVVGVPDADDGGEGLDALVREATAVFAEHPGIRRSFSVGISRPVTSAADLPEAYEQAVKSVRVGRQLHGLGAVAHFDRLGVYRLLSLVADTDELRSFVRETLGDLAGEDEPEAADLRRTLQVLLETNLNVAETARRLHFHYNTLRYRIGKLERMLGRFTEDAHLRLNITLALHVLRMRGI